MIEPKVRYLSQRDNINPFTSKLEPSSQCMVASFTMIMNWLGDKYNKEELSKQFNEFLELTLVGKNSKEVESRRYNSYNHAEICNAYIKHIKAPLNVFFKSGVFSYDEIKKISEIKKSPLIVGSMITHHGHIIVYTGNDSWNDPYGFANEQGQYIDKNGEGVKYSENFCRNFIFREVDPNTKLTSKANTKRTCWYIEGIE